MKRKFYTYLSAGLILATSCIFSNAVAQNQEYWRENFDGTGPTGDPGTSTVVADYTGPSGLWKFYGSYLTTGQGCLSGAPAASGGSRHVRSTNNTGLIDTAYIITPVVNYGIREVHIVASRQNRRLTFYKTTDTAVATMNWILAAVVNKSAISPPLCQDTIIMINDAAAKRIMIKFERNGNSDIDSISLTSVNAIVPIRFGSINAQQANGFVKVNWTILTEINTLTYDIEKSIDGRRFVSIGSIAASNAGKYSWIDNNLSSNDSYYRIKGMDKDGAVTYGTIVRINNSKKLPELVIMPNPVQAGLLNIQMSNAEKGIYSLQLYNNNGALIFSSMLTNEGGAFSKSVTLPASVTKGVYQLQLTSGATRLSKPVIVQ